jgi:hypothetical protein
VCGLHLRGIVLVAGVGRSATLYTCIRLATRACCFCFALVARCSISPWPGHLQRFKPELRALSPSLINASISMHSVMVGHFHKSVRKFHYEFNLRHIARVFQGLLMADPNTINAPAKLALLWLHETMRCGVCVTSVITADANAG